MPVDRTSTSSICVICSAQKPKYKCPGCSRATCCLACSRKHKVDFSCTGERDRLAFVDLREFDDNHLMSDFALLQAISRDLDEVSRKSEILADDDRKAPFLIKKRRALVQQCQNRGVDIQLTDGLVKSKRNCSFYHKKLGKLFWSVEFHVGAKAVFVKCADETWTLREAFNKALVETEHSLSVGDGATFKFTLSSNKEPFHFASSISLKEALVGKTLFEYPAFTVEV
eukprot:Partr_v1_DN24313_c0_g1_i2_m31823 putative Zinc finger, HIT-type containing 6